MSTAVLTPAQAAPVAKLIPRNDVNVLRGVTWEEYRALRDDSRNDGVRMYFADGELLLMTIGQLHGRIAYLTGLLLLAWSQKHNLPTICLRDWTMRRDDKEVGLESDNCWYIRSIADVSGRGDIDLTVDPPPDLAVEADITTNSHVKFAIYAELGIPELWHWEDAELTAYRRDGEGYSSVAASVEVAGVPLDVASELIRNHPWDSDADFLRLARQRL